MQLEETSNVCELLQILMSAAAQNTLATLHAQRLRN